jgi:hypothetical protein
MLGFASRWCFGGGTEHGVMLATRTVAGYRRSATCRGLRDQKVGQLLWPGVKKT